MENLQVEGGEANWHPSHAFRLDWTQVPGPPLFPRAVVYRLYDAGGRLIEGPVRNSENVRVIEPLEVPPRPGEYTVEAWLEDSEGRAGPPSRATLRFDDTVPAPAAPQPPEGWLAGREIALLKINHPTGPLPPSGIRGYAVSLDTGGGSPPPAPPGWCSAAETDLPQGIGGNTIALGTLPEARPTREWSPSRDRASPRRLRASSSDLTRRCRGSPCRDCRPPGAGVPCG